LWNCLLLQDMEPTVLSWGMEALAHFVFWSPRPNSWYLSCWHFTLLTSQWLSGRTVCFHWDGRIGEKVMAQVLTELGEEGTVKGSRGKSTHPQRLESPRWHSPCPCPRLIPRQALPCSPPCYATVGEFHNFHGPQAKSRFVPHPPGLFSFCGAENGAQDLAHTRQSLYQSLNPAHSLPL
jgi:hypothetical protein